MSDELRALSNAISSLQIGKAEQALLEQSLGSSFLQRLQGREVRLADEYARLGGHDALTTHILEKMTARFNELDLSPGADTLGEVIADPSTKDVIRTTAKMAVIAANRDVPGQPSHTLASFVEPEILEQQISD